MDTNAEVTGHGDPVAPARERPRARNDRPGTARSVQRTIAAGTVASVMIFFGSLGVGWLARVSPLLQNPLVMWLRYETVGVVLAILLLAVGSMILVRQWLRLGQKLKSWGPGSGAWVLAAIFAWSVPLAFTVPPFSRDVYSYIGQGRVVQSGLNPYEYGVSTIENFFQLGADQLWAQSPPPYGPVFLWLEQVVVTVTDARPDPAVVAFRVLCILSVVACMWVIPRLARLHGVNPARALWLSVANPLFLTNFIAAVHNDVIMVALALLGAYAAATHRNWKGGLIGTTLVTLSVGIKPITLVFLPFIGLLWAGRNASWPRKFAVWFLTLAYSMSLLGLMGWVTGFGFGWVAAMTTPGTVSIWYAPIGLLGLFAMIVGDALTSSGRGWMDAVHTAGTVLSALIVLALMFVGRDARIFRRLAWAFAALVLLAPIIQAWYVVWLIPLFAVTGIRKDWQLDVMFFLATFFSIYAVADQLDVFPYLDLSLTAGRVISTLVALTFGVYLWFFDPSTRRISKARDRGTPPPPDTPASDAGQPGQTRPSG